MNPVVLYAKKSTFVALRKTGSKIVKVDSISSKDNPQIHQKRTPTCALPKALLICDVFCNSGPFIPLFNIGSIQRRI